jgi:hypothetical protein
MAVEPTAMAATTTARAADTTATKTMPVWVIFIALAAVLWAVFGDSDKPVSSSGHSSPSYTHSPAVVRWTDSSATEDDDDDDESGEDKEDGEYDCTVANVSRGNGPYSLSCEKDGDEIKIRFPNGGHITVDEDGFHPERGDHWEVELDD